MWYLLLVSAASKDLHCFVLEGSFASLSFDKSVNKLWHRIAAAFRRRRRERFLALFPPDVYQSVIDLGGLVKEWEDDPRKVTILNLMSLRELSLRGGRWRWSSNGFSRWRF